MPSLGSVRGWCYASNPGLAWQRCPAGHDRRTDETEVMCRLCRLGVLTSLQSASLGLPVCSLETILQGYVAGD